ncbi:hypothetical protein [Psychrosphaera aestuarii]|uniref:hypothetical protein n=1 Tax=Psychrosphaera aestuarii TaxID=1266052 RepID=UPI001B3338E6|nr:hypothetical protein [Psychrosphaera aestuarii]
MHKLQIPHINRTEKKLVFNRDDLNDLDIVALLKCAANSTGLTETLLITSACTGRPIDNIIDNLHKVRIVEKDNCGIMLTDSEYPGSNDIRDSAHSIILPYNIAETLLNQQIFVHELDYIQRQAKNFLQRINHKFYSSLTPVRIANLIKSRAFKFDLAREEFIWLNEPEIGRCGVSCKIHTNKVSFKDNLSDHVSGLFVCAEKPEAPILSRGTTFSPSPNERIIEQLERLRMSPTLDIVSFHNRYTEFTLQLLEVATGYHAVKYQFNSIECFDLIDGNVMIDDKHCSGPESIRRHDLDAIAFQHLNNYLEHLENLQKWYKWDQAEISNDIQQSLNANAPLFRYIKAGKLVSDACSSFSILHSVDYKPVRGLSANV